MSFLLPFGVLILAGLSCALGRKTGYRPINRFLVAFFVAASLWAAYSLLLFRGLNLFVVFGNVDRDIGSFFFLFFSSILSVLIFIILGFQLSVEKKSGRSRQLLVWELASAIIVAASFLVCDNFSLPGAVANTCLALLVNRTAAIAVTTTLLFPIALAQFQIDILKTDPLSASAYGSACFLLLGSCFVGLQEFERRKGFRESAANTSTPEAPSSHSEAPEVSRPISEYRRGFISFGAFIAIIAVLLEFNLQLIAPQSLNRLLVRALCLSFALPAFYLVTVMARLPMRERQPRTLQAFGVYAVVFVAWSLLQVYQ